MIISMKSLITGLVFLGLTLPGFSIERAELDYRIGKLMLQFQEMQLKPDKRVPAEKLRNAQGVILLERTKAGLVFAFEGGSGVAMVRDPKSGQWSPPAFFKASEASFGAQIGGQHSFVVILLMNTNTTRILTEPTFEFGGEASGTAGNSSTGVASAVASVEQLVLIYSDSSGLYAGAAIKGGSLAPDPDANVAYYSQFLSTKEILFDRKVKPSEAAADLARKLDDYSR